MSFIDRYHYWVALAAYLAGVALFGLSIYKTRHRQARVRTGAGDVVTVTAPRPRTSRYVVTFILLLWPLALLLATAWQSRNMVSDQLDPHQGEIWK